MNGQRHATMVAAATLALTLTPLLGVFEGLGWTFPVLLAITIIAVTGSLVRAAGRGQGLQTLAMAAALLVVLTAGFGGGTGFVFVIPTPATFAHWAQLAGSGVADIVVNTPPVAPEGGILFLTVVGVGVVAILHDMFVVGLRTPALAGLTLLTMYLVPVSVAPEATAWFWFILPAVAYLWILADDNLRRVSAFGHRFTGAGQLVGQGFPSPMARTARWSAVAFIAATLTILTVVPVNTSGLVDRVAGGFGGEGDAYGLGDVNPWAQLSGSLNRPEAVDVLRVTTTDPNPRYLRMHVLDELNNGGFVPNDYDGEAGLDQFARPGIQQEYTAEIENLNSKAPVVPVYGTPTGLDIRGDWRIDADTAVIVGDTMAEVDAYTQTYIDPAPDTAELARSPGMDPGDDRWEANTEHPDVPELTEIVQDTTRGASTVHEKVLAVLDYLSVSNGFRYSLETAEADSGEAVLDFLTNKSGFCQQYAATMAWMLREADVPARVVIGMSQGRRDGESWILTSHDYHAWVEVYYEGPGWVTYDPTPAGGVPGSVSFPWAAEPADTGEQPTTDPGETADPTADPSAGDPSAADPTEFPGGEAPDGSTGSAADGGSGTGSTFNPAWLALLLVLAVPFIPALWRGGIRRSRLDPQRLSAQSAWSEAADLATDYGVSLSDSLTPRQAGGVLAQAAPGAREAATALGSAMAQHRYAPREAPTAGLGDAVTDLRTELDRLAPRRQRLRARFWPASLAAKLAARRTEGDAAMVRRSEQAAEKVRAVVRRRGRSNSRKGGSVTGRP